MGSFSAENMRFFLYIFPVLLLSVAIHEFAHCWTTDRLGDDTPRMQGRLTLNPLAHLDPLGTVMMVVSSLSGFGFGWGKSSPMNPYNFANPARDRMLSALAGPVSNILQMLAWASIGVLAKPFIPADSPAICILYLSTYGVVINAILAGFNLLPVYPLDGHHVLSYLAPPSLRPVIDNPAWGVVFLILVFTGAFRVVVQPVLIGAVVVTHFLVGWTPTLPL